MFLLLSNICVNTEQYIEPFFKLKGKRTKVYPIYLYSYGDIRLCGAFICVYMNKVYMV